LIMKVPSESVRKAIDRQGDLGGCSCGGLCLVYANAAGIVPTIATSGSCAAIGPSSSARCSRKSIRTRPVSAGLRKDWIFRAGILRQTAAALSLTQPSASTSNVSPGFMSWGAAKDRIRQYARRWRSGRLGSTRIRMRSILLFPKWARPPVIFLRRRPCDCAKFKI